MTMDDEAQPKRTRKRRRTYAKRVELRLTESQLDLAKRARSAAIESAGRNVTLSEIVRSSIDDGCKSIIKSMRTAPARSGADGARLEEAFTALTDEIQAIRSEVRRVGHNVNAMAKIAHATGRADGDLSEVKEQLAAIDARLLEAATTAVTHMAGDDDD